jgi:probable rRNA maturation factor
MAIQFFFLQHNVSLPNRTALKKSIEELFRKEGNRLASLSYIFCSDEYLLRINKSYLKHNYYTDIITFDMSESPGETTGEIYISTDRVRENAANLDVSIKEELHRVIFHGALHLCGYKDTTVKDAKTMRRAEDKYLAAYFK